MSRTKRPRKQYRPRPIGRPMLTKMRRDLITPAYLGIDTLCTGTDPAAVDSAWHSLAACLDYMYVACGNTERIAAAEAIEEGLKALGSLQDRAKRTGVMRCTGLELAKLRSAVNTCDAVLPLLRTDHIVAAVHTVDRALFGVEERIRQERRVV